MFANLKRIIYLIILIWYKPTIVRGQLARTVEYTYCISAER